MTGTPISEIFAFFGSVIDPILSMMNDGDKALNKKKIHIKIYCSGLKNLHEDIFNASELRGSFVWGQYLRGLITQ